MKTRLILISVAATALFADAALAQGRYGADSANCVRNFQLYRDYTRQGNLKEAYPFWVETMNTCPPTVSENMYIEGARILKYKIDQTKNQPELRDARIDSLMNLYDERAQNYPNSRSSANSFKAFDMMRYLPADKKAIQATFMAAIEAGAEKTDAATMVVALQKTIEAYKDSTATTEEVINLYNQLSKYMDTQIKANANAERLQTASQDLDNLFANSGVASCDNIIPIFSARFKEAPEDTVLLAAILKILGDNNCVQTDLYAEVGDAFHRLKPSAPSAYALGRIYITKGDHTKGLEYLREAVELETDPVESAKYLIEIANVYLRQINSPANAVANAKSAFAKDPKNGRAYIIIGSAWSMLRCGDEMDQKAVFWVAVDYFAKAKQIDETLTEEANRMIGTYSQYYPLQADAFMYDLVDGNAYTVSCGGMTERTTVRTRK